MKIMSSLLKVSAIMLFVVAITSCVKSDDPYSSYTPEREAGMISDWLSTMVSRNMNIDTTSSGLYYIVSTVGQGATVQPGDTVTVKYTGIFLDGSLFDGSAYHTDQAGTKLPYFSADSTYTYIHQSPDSETLSMIKGWEEAVQVMNKGEEAAFLIPSAKAYGATGNSAIPPYTPLIFIIKIVNFK